MRWRSVNCPLILRGKRNRSLDQSYGAIDLALESSLVSTVSGRLETRYDKDPDFRYVVSDKEIVLFYGASEKAYRFLVHDDVKISESEGKLVLQKNG